MRLAEIVAEIRVGEAGLRVMLDPAHAARGEVGGGAETRLLLQHLEGNPAHLEGEARLLLAPAADREDLAAHLPDMRAAPLHDVAGGGKGAAEAVELLVVHRSPIEIDIRH